LQDDQLAPERSTDLTRYAGGVAAVLRTVHHKNGVRPQVLDAVATAATLPVQHVADGEAICLVTSNARGGGEPGSMRHRWAFGFVATGS
jgi:hypothetical protein